MFLFVGIILTTYVSATGVTLIHNNSTFSTVFIDDSINLYAYEINIDYTGSVLQINHSGFLVRPGSGEKDCSAANETNDICNNGDSTYGDAYGGSSLPYVRAIYGSRLDNTATGINGTGQVFTIIHDGVVSLRSALFVNNLGEEEYVYFTEQAAQGAGSIPSSQKEQQDSQGNQTINVSQDGEIQCSWDYFSKTPFKEWSIPHIGQCSSDYVEQFGNKIWPGSGRVGALILIAIVGVIILFYNKARKKVLNKPNFQGVQNAQS